MQIIANNHKSLNKNNTEEIEFSYEDGDIIIMENGEGKIYHYLYMDENYIDLALMDYLGTPMGGGWEDIFSDDCKIIDIIPYEDIIITEKANRTKSKNINNYKNGDILICKDYDEIYNLLYLESDSENKSYVDLNNKDWSYRYDERFEIIDIISREDIIFSRKIKIQ